MCVWRRLVAAAAILPCLGALAACERGPSGPQSAGETVTVTLDWDGRERSYRLFTPTGLVQPAPLVLMLHGGLGTAEHAQEHYGWDTAAREHGFAVAYPDGVGRTWNAGGGCCGRADRQKVDDVGFLTEVVADVGRRVAIDPQRIYATGMSNGGMMSYRLACETTIFAAIAPVAATMLTDCIAPHPVSLLHIHGLDDASVRFDGAPGTGIATIGGPDVSSLVESWRDVAGCDPPTTTVEGPVTTVAAQCPEARAVVLVTVARAGHQWPGSTTSRGQRAAGADPPATAIDATSMIAAFLLAHPRP